MSYDFAADKSHHPAWANYDPGPETLNLNESDTQVPDPGDGIPGLAEGFISDLKNAGSQAP